MNKNLSIRAGDRAMEIIRDEGLNLSRVKVLAGASGSAKFLVLTGIDRAVMSLLKDRIAPLFLVGTSIGAFRMAAYCQADPIEALETLEHEYIAQRYSINPSQEEITRGTLKILDAYIDDAGLGHMLNHPFMHINFLADRCKGILQYEHRLLQVMGLSLAAGVNLLSRKGLGMFFSRALFSAPGRVAPFAGMNEFPLERYGLTPDNFKTALLSSGSIPFAMQGVSNIDGAPGVFVDGGVVDYHLDLPFLPGDREGLVLYPHFYETITPGWMDKNLNRKPDSINMENVVVIAPSPAFVETLPGGQIPDRKDFTRFRNNAAERRQRWQKALEMSLHLGDEFLEAIESGRIKEMVRPLKTQ